MKPRYPKEVQRVMKFYDAEYGLETVGTWFVRPAESWFGNNPLVFSGKLKEVLKMAMDQYDFFLPDTTIAGSLVKAKVILVPES